MMRDQEINVLMELRDRCVRMESRMVQMGDFVGINLRERQRIEVKRDGQGDVYVEIDALDVSLSRILVSLREQGHRAGEIPVLLKGQRVATVFPART
jgi:hypothetical protein